MKNIQLQVPARVPRLYYGATAGQMELTGREKLGEAVYTTLALVSYILFLAGGVLGYFYDGWLGSITFTLLGYVLGMWMRRSLGMRGRKIAPGIGKGEVCPASRKIDGGLPNTGHGADRLFDPPDTRGTAHASDGDGKAAGRARRGGVIVRPRRYRLARRRLPA